MLKEEITLYRGSSVSYEKVEKSEASPETFHFVFSTADIDSYGDIIEQEGWVLDRYQKNNIILWAHDHKTPGIGYAKDVGKSPVLNGNLTFNPKEIDPFGGKIRDLIEFGTIKAGSVGLNPFEWDVIEHKEGSYTVIDGFRFKKQELMEFSVCNVPANPFALVDFSVEPKKQKAVKPLSGFQYFLPGKE